MNIQVEYDINTKEFLEVIESVGFKTYSVEQVGKKFKNTMYMVKVLVDNEVAEIGRVVGDYSIVCMLSDICEQPKYQHNGIGLKIVNELKRMIEVAKKEIFYKFSLLHKKSLFPISKSMYEYIKNIIQIDPLDKDVMVIYKPLIQKLEEEERTNEEKRMEKELVLNKKRK